MLQKSLDELLVLRKDLDKNLNDEKSVVTEYCETLRYEVYLTTESLIEELNKSNDELIGKIDVYEKDLVDSIAKQTGDRESRREWTELLSRCDQMAREIEDRIAKEAESATDSSQMIKDATDLKFKLKKSIGESRDFLFSNNYIYFNQKIDLFAKGNILGSIEYVNTCSILKATNTWKLTREEDMEILRIKNDRFAILADGSAHVYTNENKKECVVSDWDNKITSIIEISPKKFALATENQRQVQTIKFDDHYREIVGKSVLGNHDDLVTCLLMLNTCLLASGSTDSTIKIWDVNDVCLVKELDNEGSVIDLMITPLGLLVSKSFYEVKVWDVEPGETVWSKRFDHLLNEVCITPDGDLLVLTESKHVQVFKPQDGALIRKFKLKGDMYTSLSVLSNGDLAVVNKDGRSVGIHDSGNGRFKRALVGHEAEIVSLVVLETGQIVCLSKGGSLTSWKV